MTYDDSEIDDALDRIDADVKRRFDIPEFHGPAMAAVVGELRRMEAARRAGDSETAAAVAIALAPALEKYRPTNATSRAKAVLAEIVAALTAAEPSA